MAHSIAINKYGLSVFCIRIGNVSDEPADERQLSIWLDPEDLVRLIRIGLESPDLVYEVVYGVSANRRSWWDNDRAIALGYQPVGDAERFAEEALAKQASLTSDPVAELFQGGAFCSEDFLGHLSRLQPKS